MAAPLFAFCIAWVCTFVVSHFIIFVYNMARHAPTEEIHRDGKAGHKVAIWLGVAVGIFYALKFLHPN
jgi:hypothetical protein